MSQTLLEKKWRLASSSCDPQPEFNQRAMSKAGRSVTPSETSNSQSGKNQSSMSMGSGNKLAQEIYDEFLVCKICLECYKSPKCLDCLHTFCETCIESHINAEPSYKKYSDYREFTCPLCRKRTQLPVGGVRKLPDNFLVSSLTETVGRQRPGQQATCDICRLVGKKTTDASSKCLDCCKLLCTQCVQMHKLTKVTSAHSLFDVEIEQEIGCKDHPEEVIRFYCEPCDSCICIVCTFNEHREHEISQFNEAAQKYRAGIEALLADCKAKIEKCDAMIKATEKCEKTIKQVEEKVRDKAISFVQEIRNKEKQVQEELHKLYGPECIECIDNKKDLNQKIENLRSTCSITEVILLGKDIELLLLKKDVEDKLILMNQLDFSVLPPTIDKDIDFVEGCVEFGRLHDKDKPQLKKISLTRVRRGKRQDSLKGSRSKWMTIEGENLKPEDIDLFYYSDEKGDDLELVQMSDTSTQTDLNFVGVIRSIVVEEDEQRPGRVERRDSEDANLAAADARRRRRLEKNISK